MHKKDIIKKAVKKYGGKGGPGSGTVTDLMSPTAMSTASTLMGNKFSKLGQVMKNSAPLKSEGNSLRPIMKKGTGTNPAVEAYGRAMKGAYESKYGKIPR